MTDKKTEPKEQKTSEGMSAATRQLHEALLRHLKGAVTAYERWLSQQ